MQPFIKESSQPVKESGFRVTALGSTGCIFSEFISHTAQTHGSFISARPLADLRPGLNVGYCTGLDPCTYISRISSSINVDPQMFKLMPSTLSTSTHHAAVH
jgi:hypothetical protein